MTKLHFDIGRITINERTAADKGVLTLLQSLKAAEKKIIL